MALSTFCKLLDKVNFSLPYDTFHGLYNKLSFLGSIFCRTYYKFFLGNNNIQTYFLKFYDNNCIKIFQEVLSTGIHCSSHS